MYLISEKSDLLRCIQKIRHTSQPHISWDTEFLRQNTFYPELCLVQVAIQEAVFLIDVEAFSREVLKPLFFGHGKILVVHSGKQDLEILQHLYAELPSLVFDTQIAAQFLGLGETIGYDNLVHYYLGIHVDKSQQHTNWKKRPLSPLQLYYATHDVLYLEALYPKLLEDLEKRGFKAWVLDEMKSLSTVPSFEDTALMRMARLGISKKKYALAFTMMQLREFHAKDHNVNRTRYLTDAMISILCKIKDEGEAKSYLERTLDPDVKKALLPKLIEGLHSPFEVLSIPPSLQKDQMRTLEALKQYRNERANALSLPLTLLATSQDLKDYITQKKGRLLTTWRYEIFKDVV